MIPILEKICDIDLSLKPASKSPTYTAHIVDGLDLRVNPNRYGIKFEAAVKKADDSILTVECASLKNRADGLQGLSTDIDFVVQNEAYFFCSNIMGADADNNLLIATPQQIKPVPQREDCRLYTKIPVYIKEVDGRPLDDDASRRPRLIARDISAGGMRLECRAGANAGGNGSTPPPNAQTAGSVVDIEFHLPQQRDAMEALAEITWINRLAQSFEIGMRFLNVTKMLQQYIVQYIYQEQIKERKRRQFTQGLPAT